MTEESSTDFVLAYGLAVSAAESLHELFGALDSAEAEEQPRASGNLDNVVEATQRARTARSLLDLCGLAGTDEALRIESTEEFAEAVQEISELVYSEYLPKLLEASSSGAPDFPEMEFAKYLDAGIVFADEWISILTFNDVVDQSTSMHLTPSIRLQALAEFPTRAMRYGDSRLDADEIQRALERVAAITSTELFDPPARFLRDFDTAQELEDYIRHDLRQVVAGLTVDFSSGATKENSLRTTLSYLIASCKMHKEMTKVEGPDQSVALS